MNPLTKKSPELAECRRKWFFCKERKDEERKGLKVFCAIDGNEFSVTVDSDQTEIYREAVKQQSPGPASAAWVNDLPVISLRRRRYTKLGVTPSA